MTEFTVQLPDEFARKAQAAGLLNDEGIERALRDALMREAGRKLLEIGQVMRELPAMSEEEIQAEIEAVRAARRAKRDAPGA
jgi:2-phospho-L-lactate guanylyltransferase (CobY/MobA/RfbA family)